jgi:hypothetical protein
MEWRRRATSSPGFTFAVGSLEIQLAKGTLRVAGNVDVVVLRTAIECLLGRGNRLEASGTQLRSADGGVKEKIFSIFWCILVNKVFSLALLAVLFVRLPGHRVPNRKLANIRQFRSI